MRSLLRIPAVLASIAIAATVLAQGTPPGVSTTSPKTVVAGKAFAMTITVTIPQGLHGYQNPPTDPSLIPISVTLGDKVFSIVKVNYPVGKPTKVPGEDKPVNIYAGTIKIPVTLKAPARLGKAALKLVVGYQECNDQSCFAPSSVNVATDVNVVKALTPVVHKIDKSR